MELSQHVQLNQIVGLGLGGTLNYDNSVNPDNTVSSYVTHYPSGSAYSGAQIFNAQKAWTDAPATYNTTYKGIPGKKFIFTYTAPGSCVGSQTKKIVIIVTDTL
jgi:hypothetical protein